MTLAQDTPIPHGQLEGESRRDNGGFKCRLICPPHLNPADLGNVNHNAHARIATCRSKKKNPTEVGFFLIPCGIKPNGMIRVD